MKRLEILGLARGVGPSVGDRPERPEHVLGDPRRTTKRDFRCTWKRWTQTRVPSYAPTERVTCDKTFAIFCLHVIIRGTDRREESLKWLSCT
jgi:hypothetical protein